MIGLECLKGGMHDGERLNLVCTEPQCMEQSLLCGVCYSETHTSHRVKPLKMFLSEATASISSSSQSGPTDESTAKRISDGQAQLISLIKQQSAKSIEHAKLMGTRVEQLAHKFKEEVRGSVETVHALYALFQKVVGVQELEVQQSAVKEIIGLMPVGFGMHLTHDYLQLTIRRYKDSLQKASSSKQKLQQTILEDLQKYLIGLLKESDIFSKTENFQFSKTFHHPNISVDESHRIRSTGSYVYRYALMEPSLELSRHSKKAAFQIIENNSNWLAVGICHKETVVSKGYGFNFSEIGHGGYMVSANGGSWSHIDPISNNTLKTFTFTKNDIIVVQYDPFTQTINFTKESTLQTYKLKFVAKEQDELHFCAMFYYANDVIQQLPGYR